MSDTGECESEEIGRARAEQYADEKGRRGALKHRRIVQETSGNQIAQDDRCDEVQDGEHARIVVEV